MDNKCLFPLLILLFKVYVLLNTLISRSDQACDSGFFGENCTYLCHCFKSKCCGEKTGQCPPKEGCEIGYFGPSCQYVDMVHQESDKRTVPSFIRDSDDKTCNPDQNATSVLLIQKKPYPFSWIRIVVNNKTNLINFTTTLNNGLPCTNEKKYTVSDTIVDVTCNETTLYLKRLQIDGPIVGSICTVYISGGRNTAVRQETNQTGVFHDAYATRAVDGNTNPHYSNASCAHTENRRSSKPDEPWWLLIFSRPQILYYVRLYNRADFQARLNKYKLEAFDENLDLIFTYRDNTTVNTTLFTADIWSEALVTSLKVTQNHVPKPYPVDQVLTLCEVETYGDLICPTDYYGLDCEHTCLCNKAEVCHGITGACALICPAGYYGPNCTSRCNENCLESICEWVTGNCFNCKPGYMGDMCDLECDHGYYGDKCMLNCSKGCLVNCNNINGTCDCKREFKGTHCTVCADEFYGPNCVEVCSIRCVNQHCDRKTGKCYSCVEGYKGEYCDEGPSSPWLLIFSLLILLLWLLLYIQRRRPATKGAEDIAE